MMKTRPWLLALLAVPSLLTALHAQPSQAPVPPGDEALSILRRYLAIDTTNPPGNEMKTARFLEEILRKEGITPELVDLGNGRANLAARLKGDGSRKPIVLLHHMDVVPADERFWPHPPFGGTVADGKIYGRGAVDIKTKGVIDLVSFLRIRRSGVPLKRDLVYLAVADEECGSLGTQHVVEKRPDLVAGAEILLDEGAFIHPDDQGQPRHWFVSVTEKRALWLRLTFEGVPGHGSMPRSDSSVNRAVRAAASIAGAARKVRLHPALTKYVIHRAQKLDWRKLPGALATLESSLGSDRFLEALTVDPRINECLRDTVSVTVLSGSSKINVIPPSATIGLDCRLLPGTDLQEFLGWIRGLTGDPKVKMAMDSGCEGQPATFSPVDSPFFAALVEVARKRLPTAEVIPMILSSTTDATLFRPLGIGCYGFEPYALTPDEEDRSHGNGEYIRVSSLGYGVDLLVDLIRTLNH